MKKILTVCLAAALILSFSSCSKAKKVSVEEPIVSESEISPVSDVEETEETEEETSADTTTQTSAVSTTAAGTEKTTAAKSANKTTVTKPKTTKDITDNLKKEITNPTVPSGVNNSSTAPSSGGDTVKNVTPPVSTKTPTDIQKQYYAAYQKASQKTNALTSCDYTTSIKLDMSMAGQSPYSVRETGNIKIAQNGSDIKMLENETMQENGDNPETMSFYYADGTLYISENGEKYKLKRNPSDLQSQTGVSLTGSSSGLSENDFAYSESASSNGDTIITLDLTPESTKEIVNSSLVDLGNDMNFSKIAFRFVINKDGYIVRQDMECNATLTATENGQAQTANLYLSLDITLNNPGQPVTITPPSDLSSYREAIEADR